MIILVHLLQLVWQMLFRIYSAYYLFRFVISSNVLYILYNDPTAPLNHQGRLRNRIRYTLSLRSRCHLQSLIHKQALLFYCAKKYSRIRQCKNAEMFRQVGQEACLASVQKICIFRGFSLVAFPGSGGCKQYLRFTPQVSVTQDWLVFFIELCHPVLIL